MEFLGALFMPMLVSAVLVFIASYIVWQVLPYHKGDEGQDQAMDAKKLIMHFVHCFVVAIFVAYLATLAFGGMSPDYMEVFRFTAAATFSIYGLYSIQEVVWGGKSWSVVWKTFLDALIYGLLTGGAFGWLW